MRAIVSPRLCTSLRRQVLEHLGRFLLAERHQQDRGVLEAGFVHRVHAAQRARVRRLRRRRPSRARCRRPRPGCPWRAPCARSRCWSQVRGAASAGGRAATARRRRPRRCALPGCAGCRRRRARPSAPGRTRPKKTSSATSASAGRQRRGAQQVEHVGLLPQRRRRRSRPASILNGALITLTESPRSLLKPMLSRTSAVSFSISSAVERHLRRLALGVGDAAVVDDDGGVEPLDGAGRVARHAHGLVDFVVGHRLAPAAAAGGAAARRGLQRLRGAGERRGRRRSAAGSTPRPARRSAARRRWRRPARWSAGCGSRCSRRRPGSA